MFKLRNNIYVNKYIGDDVVCTSHKSILGFFRELLGMKPQDDMFGHVNHLRGSAQLQMVIEGTHGKGHVQLQAYRKKEGSKEWILQQLQVTCAGEQIVNLA